MFIVLKFILKAFLVGLFGACAMGPIFLLILNRSLDKGFLAGFFSAVGASCADGIMFSMGLVGFLSLANHHLELLKAFELIGGIVLITLGVFNLWNLFLDFSLQSKSLGFDLSKTNPSGNNLWLLTISTFLLNISNPMSILFFTSIAGKIFPELIIESIGFGKLFYAGLFCALGSLMILTLVSLFASLIAKILFKKIRAFLQILTAIIFIVLGLYLIVEFMLFLVGLYHAKIRLSAHAGSALF